MKRWIRLLTSTVVLGAASVSIARSASEQEDRIEGKKGEVTMSAGKNVEVMLAIFRAVEGRDERRFSALSRPDLEIHWPPSLPYGGSSRGPHVGRPSWSVTWEPLQPTERERRMDPRVVAAGDDEVVVLWRQRGVSPAGERFDGEVLALYRLHEGKLARAQMFYFDTAAVAAFLARAKGE